MPYDGPERRKGEGMECPLRCKEKVDNTADAVIRIEGKLLALDARINGSLDKMNSFRESGVWWRGSIVAIVLWLITTAVGLGMYKQQIDVNTDRLEKIETYHQNSNGVK